MYKIIHWVVAAVFVLFSPALLALGLGGAVVESYLEQPLDVRIELISQSSEELQSITTGLASADDFELLGLSRSTITVPLEFELVTDTEKPYIRITSDLSVNEPVVQVLVEVVWASGRMLREYTLFLDPPTIPSTAPPVVIKPTPQPAPVEKAVVESKPAPAVVQRTPKPEVQEPAVEEPVIEEAETEAPVAEEPEEEAVAEEPVADEPAAEEFVEEEPATEELAIEEPVAEESAEEEAVTDEPEAEESVTEEAVPDEEPVSESAEEQVEEQVEEQEPAEDQFSDDEVYGPVARGETLWGIARDFSRNSGYSINQTMLALQRKNPEAFIRDNINSLKSGAILRLPAFHEIAELTSREAMLEVMRQEEEIRTGTRTVAPDFSTPTVADSGDYQESVTEKAPEPEIEEDPGHLELVPPVADSEDLPLSEQTPEQGASSQAIKEELSRTEEELVNVQQENVYLNERIEELEADAQEDTTVAVEDSDLAKMESTLEEKRASDEPEPPVAITPGGETQAWYAGKTALIGGLAIVLIAIIVWGLRRRSTGQLGAEHAEAVQTIADEAEGILTELDTVEDEDEPGEQPEQVAETDPEPEPEP
jgi:pilus assembly protein FimV